MTFFYSDSFCSVRALDEVDQVFEIQLSKENMLFCEECQ